MEEHLTDLTALTIIVCRNIDSEILGNVFIVWWSKMTSYDLLSQEFIFLFFPSGDAPDLRPLPAQGAGMPGVPGALPGPAPETQVCGQAQWSPTSDDGRLIFCLSGPLIKRNFVMCHFSWDLEIIVVFVTLSVCRNLKYFVLLYEHVYRYAEKTAEELKKLKEEFAQLTAP